MWLRILKTHYRYRSQRLQQTKNLCNEYFKYADYYLRETMCSINRKYIFFLYQSNYHNPLFCICLVNNKSKIIIFAAKLIRKMSVTHQIKVSFVKLIKFFPKNFAELQEILKIFYIICEFF